MVDNTLEFKNCTRIIFEVHFQNRKIKQRVRDGDGWQVFLETLEGNLTDFSLTVKVTVY